MGATAAVGVIRRLEGRRILLVEDNRDLREGMAICLESEGALVAVAATGSDAYGSFRHDLPDVLISDLWMPNGTGYELIERLRQLPPEQGGLVPAIAMSAAENMDAALLAGFHAFIAKPFDWNALVDTLADFTAPQGPGQSVAPWSIAVRRPSELCIRFAGRMQADDMRAMTAALLVHLRRGPMTIVSDVRRLTGFSPSVASIAERAVWTYRRNIVGVRVVGGSFAARLVSAAACKVLGVSCTFTDASDAN